MSDIELDDDQKLFTDITIQGKLLCDCELVYINKVDHSRMYVVKEGNSFWCHAIEWCWSSMSPDDDIWAADQVAVRTIFDSVAYFDGVRHLQFNRVGGEMDGYLYYPNVQDIINMLTIVREIELEVCRDCEK